MAASNSLFSSRNAGSNVSSSVSFGRISNLSDAHDGKCPLCVQAFHIREPVKKLICQHTFHPICIDRWLETSILCPVCEIQVIFPLAQVVDENVDKIESSSEEEAAEYSDAICRDCHCRFHRDLRVVRPDTSAYYRCPHCRKFDAIEMIRASCVLL
jgi:hypothetical protein